MALLIIHLTDLHATERIEYLEAKAKSIASIINKHKNVDGTLLLFTGDISQSGSPEEFDQAKIFLKTIENNLVDKDNYHVCLCPGNHDRKFGENETVQLSNLTSVNSSNFDTKLDENKLLMSNYRSFSNSFQKPRSINGLLEKYTFVFKNKTYSVYSLNNALFTTFKDLEAKDDFGGNLGHIYIPNDYLNITRSTEESVFLIMHLPLNYFSLDTQKYIKQKCGKYVDFVFSGHDHKDETHLIADASQKYIEFVSSTLSKNGLSGFTKFLLHDKSIETFVYSFNDDDCIFDLAKTMEIITFEKKEFTSFNSAISKEFENISKYCEFRELGSIDMSELFVFPTITRSKADKTREIAYKSFEELFDLISGSSILAINGDDCSGKTTLSYSLFYSFIKKGFLPILCNGNDFIKASSLNKIIKTQLNFIYSDKSIFKKWEDADKEKRILIVDDFEKVPDSTLLECQRLFGKIIYFYKEKEETVIETGKGDDLNRVFLEIEPFYYDKRIELAQKLYDHISNDNPRIKESFDRDSFVGYLEKNLARLDKFNSIDPASIIVLAKQILLHYNDFTLEGYKTLYQFKVSLMLKEQLEKNRLIGKCTLNIAERVISSVAMRTYKENKNGFPADYFDDEASREEIDRGVRPFADGKRFADILVKARILRKESSSSLYSFADRNVLSYFVGKHAVTMFHSKRRDDSELRTIIGNGIYVPLNFCILMSIAANYDYELIPSFFVEDLFGRFSKLDLQVHNGWKTISERFDERKNELISITEADEKRIKQKKSENEQKRRTEYLKTINNFYYVEKLEEKVKTVQEWINVIRITSVLLNSFSDTLYAEEKSKLVQIAIKLPNAVIDYLISDLLKNLDDSFVEMKDEIIQKNLDTSIYDQFKIAILDLCRITILAMYETSYQPFVNEQISEFVSKEFDKQKDNMHDIQKLSLLSFSSKRDQFIDLATTFIKGDNDFKSSCARIISWHYCLRNYQTVKQKYKSFIDLVSKGKPNKITKAKGSADTKQRKS